MLRAQETFLHNAFRWSTISLWSRCNNQLGLAISLQPCSMAKKMTGVRHLEYFVRCGNCHASPMAKSSPMTVSEWPWQTWDAKRFSNFIRYDWSSGAGAPQTPCVSTSSHLHLQCSQTFSRKSIEPLSHWTNGDQPNLRLFNVSKRKKSSGIPDKRRVLSVEQVQNLGPWRPYRPTKNLFPKLITLISPSIKDAAGYQSNQPGNHPVGGCANVKLPRVKSTLDCRHCESAATLAPPIRLRSLTCPKKEPGEKVSSGTWQPGFHLGVVFPQRPRKPQCL